ENAGRGAIAGHVDRREPGDLDDSCTEHVVSAGREQQPLVREQSLQMRGVSHGPFLLVLVFVSTAGGGVAGGTMSPRPGGSPCVFRQGRFRGRRPPAYGKRRPRRCAASSRAAAGKASGSCRTQSASGRTAQSSSRGRTAIAIVAA